MTVHEEPAGIVYLLHLDRPVGRPQSAAAREEYGLPPRQEEYEPHAGHYLGTTNDLARRLQEHLSGNGSHLIAAARDEGIGFTLVRAWVAENRWALERTLSALKNNPRLCPLCTHPPRPAVYPGARELSAAEITEALIPF